MRMTEQTDVEIMATGRFMRMIKRGRWEYVERHNAEGAVAIIATTDANELILVEQPRVPLDQRCIELPAGLAGDSDDDRGEALIDAARRELLEEAGYEAATIEHLFTVATSPGLTNETIDLFRATGLTRAHEGGGVDHEDITVHLVPIAQVDDWLKSRAAAGQAIDVKVYTAAAMIKTEASQPGL